MIFSQNSNDLQSHKEIIYVFVSKDKQAKLSRNF